MCSLRVKVNKVQVIPGILGVIVLGDIKWEIQWPYDFVFKTPPQHLSHNHSLRTRCGSDQSPIFLVVVRGAAGCVPLPG